jgi:hypothetical protein
MTAAAAAAPNVGGAVAAPAAVAQANIPAVPAAPVLAPGVFALVPAAATNTVLDFTTRSGLAVYTSNTKSLYRSDDERFDLQSEGLQTFLSLFSRRVTSANWDVDVPVVNDANHHANGPWYNLITHHGQLDLIHLKEFSLTFIDSPTRAAQDNMMMAETLMESLSLVAIQKVMSWTTDWHLGPFNRPAALCLLKIIIRESYIDSNATIRILREQLSSLPVHLAKFSGRIPDLNQFVRTTVDQLAARGTSSSDLVANLFKGYLSSHDRTFVTYIEKKQEEFDEGEDIQPNMLMTLADNKYKILVQTGKWMTPTDEEKKIIALETKLAQLKKGTSTSKDSKDTKKAGKGKGNAGKPVPAAMTKYPGKEFVAANKSKTFDGIEHWWCTHHKRFVRHKSEECRHKKKAANPAAATPAPPVSPPTTTTSPTPNLRVSQAVLMDE